jgi:hypothetical protein
MHRTVAALPHMRHRREPMALASDSLIRWFLTGIISRLHNVQTFVSVMSEDVRPA